MCYMSQAKPVIIINSLYHFVTRNNILGDICIAKLSNSLIFINFSALQAQSLTISMKTRCLGMR